jgi:hypothetical protein
MRSSKRVRRTNSIASSAAGSSIATSRKPPGPEVLAAEAPEDLAQRVAPEVEAGAVDAPAGVRGAVAQGGDLAARLLELAHVQPP